MARVTERIRLGPAALNPFTLHPYEIAGQTAMLDAVSNGRAFLGLTKGAWLDRLGIEEERPLAALREAVAIIEALLAGDDTGVAGERFILQPGTSALLSAGARFGAAAHRHLGPGDGSLGRHRRRRAEARRERQPRPRPGRSRLDRQPRREGRRRFGQRRRRGRRVGTRTSAGCRRAVPRRRRPPRSDARARGRASRRRSSASASPARRRRWRRASSSCGTRAPTGSSWAPRRVARPSRASISSASACCRSCARALVTRCSRTDLDTPFSGTSPTSSNETSAASAWRRASSLTSTSCGRA